MTNDSTRFILDDNQQIIEYLKDSRLFGHLPTDLLNQLVPLSHLARFPKGAAIIREGHPNSEVFILIRGAVAIYSKEELIVKLKRKGDLFGEMSVITNQLCSATVVADTSVDLFSIKAKDIGGYVDIEAKTLQNTFYRLFAYVLSEKLMLTTHKARQFESTNRRLLETKHQLQSAHQEAVRANHAKSAFLANMSHEIRTPLNSIIGNTELLFYTDLTEKQEKHASTVYKSGELLLAIVNDILDFSKIEAGEMQLDEQEFDLKSLFKEMGEMFSQKASDQGVELVLWYDPLVSSYYSGDSVRIRQVLSNLIGNAIKFTLEGHVELRLELMNRQEGEDRLRFEVVDTGIGIAQNQLSHIFEKFSQADVSTSRKFGGTGLGLAICKRLIELMEGLIEVDSQQDKGSTFRFELQMERIDKPEERAVEDPDHDAFHRIRILIVDDNRAGREVLRNYIAHLGIRCSVAESAEEALELMMGEQKRGDPFDVALIDFQMPGMNGLSLGNAIGTRPSIADTVRILALSSNDPGREKLTTAGFSAVLPKPVDLSVLIDTLVQSLKTHRKPE
ncbi:MAG: response regulator [Proteobacteria bacterium]|nr:response regulator [Pseudomonadota bacterium]